MSAGNQEQTIGTSGVYGQLLSVATAATGDKTDTDVQPMSADDRKWLEEALAEFAKDSDPVRKLKELIAQLMRYTHENEEDLTTLTNIVDSLTDLVCDLDLALDFCKLSGLKVISELLDRKDDAINQRIIPIISEIAQNNPPVQKFIVQTNFLSIIIGLLNDETTSQKTRLKCVAAISSIVKGFPPAVIRFVQLQGPETVLKIFHDAFNANDQTLVHRCVVSISNIGRSAAPGLIDALKVDIKEYTAPIKEKLLTDPDKYAESLEYLES